MPNWVYNTIHVHGTEDALRQVDDLLLRGRSEVIDQLNAYIAKGHKSRWMYAMAEQMNKTQNRESAEKWADTTVGKEPRQYKGFTFFRLVPPPQVNDLLDPNWLAQYVDGDPSVMMPFWYNWNCNNWGTKWDADGEEYEIADGTLRFRLETAWSPPEPVIEAFGRFLKTIEGVESACWHWEEEQGFGAELEFDRNEEVGWSLTNEWDIPGSHADYVQRDGDGSRCKCQSENPESEYFDADYIYDDCPTKAEMVARHETWLVENPEEVVSA